MTNCKSLGAFFEFGEDELGYFFEGFEDADALDGDRFEDGFAFFLELLGELGDGHGVGEVAFVELENVGNGVEVEVVLLQVFLKVFHGFEVGVETLFLRIGDKDNAVSAFEDELTAGFVEDLAGDGVEVKTGFEAAHGPEIEGKKVEEERAVGFSSQRNHFAFLVLASVIVDPLEIGGFAAQSRAVVDKLAVNLASGKIDKGHVFSTRNSATNL